MKEYVLERRRLIAEFLSNIGVAWFAAGVIGIFVNRVNSFAEIAKSLIWGPGFSIAFLSIGASMIKGGRRR